MGSSDMRPWKTCQRILWYIGAVVRWIPVIFIFGILGWSAFAYGYVLCFQIIQSAALRVLFLVVYVLLGIIFSWSYIAVVFTSPAKVPNDFRLSSSDLNYIEQCADGVSRKNATHNVVFQKSKSLPILERWPADDWQCGIRYCTKCQHIKPDRSHHCSICGRCVPKFDHHCPWVNNCVCHSNYKYFMLFLLWALVLCLWIGFTSIPYFIKFWNGELADFQDKFHIVFLPFVAFMFSISVVGLLSFHIWLTFKNRSTIETSRYPAFAHGPDKNAYNLGWRRNFIEVFGTNACLWFIPVQTSSGNGFSYPTNINLEMATHRYA